jgi:hypothetical protein
MIGTIRLWHCINSNETPAEMSRSWSDRGILEAFCLGAGFEIDYTGDKGVVDYWDAVVAIPLGKLRNFLRVLSVLPVDAFGTADVPDERTAKRLEKLGFTAEVED